MSRNGARAIPLFTKSLSQKDPRAFFSLTPMLLLFILLAIESRYSLTNPPGGDREACLIRSDGLKPARSTVIPGTLKRRPEDECRRFGLKYKRNILSHADFKPP